MTEKPDPPGTDAAARAIAKWLTDDPDDLRDVGMALAHVEDGDYDAASLAADPSIRTLAAVAVRAATAEPNGADALALARKIYDEWLAQTGFALMDDADWEYYSAKQRVAADGLKIAFLAGRLWAADRATRLADLRAENARFLDLLKWCRPRLAKDGYRTLLDRYIANPVEPDHTPIVQSAALALAPEGDGRE